MAARKDIKETKEFITGVMQASFVITQALIDGVDIKDIFTIITKIQNDRRFKTAIEGLEKVPAEIGDLDIGESLELAGHAMEEAGDVIMAVINQKTGLRE